MSKTRGCYECIVSGKQIGNLLRGFGWDLVHLYSCCLCPKQAFSSLNQYGKLPQPTDAQEPSPLGQGLEALVPDNFPLPPFPSQAACGAGKLPFPSLPAQAPLRHIPAPHHSAVTAAEQRLTSPLLPSCSSRSFSPEEGQQLQEHIAESTGKGEGTSTAGTRNTAKPVGSIRQFIKLLPGAWRCSLFTAARAGG